MLKKLFFFVFLFFLISFSFAEKTSFIAVGHVYTDYDSLSLSVEKINEEKPDFVVFLGDVVKGEAEASLEFDEFDAIINRIDSKVYVVPGNHDIVADNDLRLKEFEKRYGGFKSFSDDDRLFLFLNSQNYSGSGFSNGINESDIESVKLLLEEKPSSIFIFMHHCLWFENVFKNKVTNPCNRNSGPNNWNGEVHSLIKEFNAWVFAGDASSFFVYNKDSVQYVASGFSAESLLPTNKPLLIKVNISDSGEVSVNPIPVTGLFEPKYDVFDDEKISMIPDETVFDKFLRENYGWLFRGFLVILILGAVFIIFLKRKKRLALLITAINCIVRINYCE